MARKGNESDSDSEYLRFLRKTNAELDEVLGLNEKVHASNPAEEKARVTQLLKALKDQSSFVRNDAAESLCQIKDTRAVMPLIKALDDRDGFVRLHAAEALEHQDDIRALEPLLHAYQKPSNRVLVAARIWRTIWKFVYAGKTLNSRQKRMLTVVIRNLPEERRLRIVYGIQSKINPEEKAKKSVLELLLFCLGDPAWDVRGLAAHVLGWLGDPRAVMPLIQMEPVVTSGERLSLGIFSKIEELYQQSGRHLPFELDPAYNSSRRRVDLLQPLEALGEINHKNEAAISFLMPYLVGPDSKWRPIAAEGLGRIDHPKTLGQIAAALRNESDEVRLWSIYALGLLNNKKAITHLTKVLNDQTPLFRLMAVNALSYFGKREVLRLIAQTLADEDEIVRTFTAYILSRFGEATAIEVKDPLPNQPEPKYTKHAAKILMAPLLKALQDENASVRYYSLRALVRLPKSKGFPTESVIEALIAILRDEGSEFSQQFWSDGRGDKENVAEVLGEYAVKSAVEPLVGALSDEDPSVRESSARALGKIKDWRAFEPLMAALSDEDCYVRESAAWSLGNMNDMRAFEPPVAVAESDNEGADEAIDALMALDETRAVARLGPWEVVEPE